MKNYINNGKNLNKKPLNLSIKNKQIAFCSNLPFWILSFSSYVDIESMNIISSDVDTNEYKLLGTKSKQIVNALKLLGMPLFLGFLKKLKSDDIENYILLNCTKSNIAKLRYIMVKKFKDELKNLQSILNEIEKLEMIRQVEMEQSYEISKKYKN